jgi:CRISPR system Cascade subunit CasA
MNPSDPVPFDLVHEPWLPVRDLQGGSAEYGILHTLGLAHELAGLSGEVPTQTFALTRLLLAVMHGALAGPRDDEEWAELWKAEKLPIATIAAYLATHQARFGLFHPETPFLQVADLHTASGATTGMPTLIADVPNGRKFFTTRLGVDFSLTPAEAARWLVHCQAFDISGIKTGAVGDERVKGGKGYPIGVGWAGLLGCVLVEGATLKETLLLNLIARDFGDYARDPAVDRPAWERVPVTAAEEVPGGRPVTGPVDLYCWQSRRIRLIPGEDGRVRDALICNGERLTPQNMHRAEPHTAWRRSNPQEKALRLPLVYMPREHNPDRAIWRGLASLLPATASRQKADAADSVSPGVLEWLSHLVVEELVPDERTVRVRSIGMVYGSNNSLTDDIIDDSLGLRAVLARQDADDLAAVAVSCVAAAEAAVRTLGNLAGDLAAAAGGEGAGLRSRVMESAYAELDSPFRRWLADLRADSDTIAVQTGWHHTARDLVGAAGADLLSRVPPACWEGRRVRDREWTAAHAVARFRRDLRQALPFAYADQAETVPA